MIVLDTTVLRYAVGKDHPLREPAIRVITAIGNGEVVATTTVEVIQEFTHAYARQRPRPEASAHGRSYARLLHPLMGASEDDLMAGLALFERVPSLGAFDSVLAAAAIASFAGTVLSADRAFGEVAEVDWLDLGAPDLFEQLGIDDG